MVLTLEVRITARVKAHDFRDWRDRVTAIGGCAAPIRLSGAFQLQDLGGDDRAHRRGHHGPVRQPPWDRSVPPAPRSR